MPSPRIGSWALLFCLSFFSLQIQANELTEYQVYKADTNNDGFDDYLLKQSPEEVEIPYDVNLQVDREGQRYLLVNNGDGSFTVQTTSDPAGNWQLIDGEVTEINYVAGAYPQIAVRIYDENGHLVGNESGYLFVIDQDSSGKLTTGKARVSQVLNNNALVSIVDINNDDLEDFVISGENVNTISSASANVSLKHDAVQNFAPKTWAGNDGAAHASVSIFIPKELGPAPNISLQYSSNAGNGPVGMGFNLTGTSKIHYCRPAADVDGTMAATPFTDEERLCLDGQYLVQTKGASRFENDATYMTEVTNHSRIRYENDSSQNQFVMQTKGGGKLYFAHARKHDQNLGKTIEWYLTRVEDEFGNGYDYLYKYDTQHEYLPILEKIEYGSIVVDFNWESRVNKTAYEGIGVTTYDDESLKHRGGATTLVRDRLASITVKRGAASLRIYELKYGVNHNNLSQLETVKVCALSAACEESSFDWFDSENNEVPMFGIPVELGDFSDKDPDQKAQYLDLNGDGYIDIMYPGVNDEWKVRLGSKSGFEAVARTTGRYEGTGEYADFAFPLKAGLDNSYSLIVADSSFNPKYPTDVSNSAFACVGEGDIYIFSGSGVSQLGDAEKTVARAKMLDSSAGKLDCRVDGEAGVLGAEKYNFIGSIQFIPYTQWYILHPEFSNDVLTVRKTAITSTMGNRLYPADINNDGLQDIVLKYEYPMVESAYRATENEATGELIAIFLARTSDTTSGAISSSEWGFDTYFLKDEQVVRDDAAAMNFVDFNRDGILDIEICSIYQSVQQSCGQYLLSFSGNSITADYTQVNQISGASKKITYQDSVTGEDVTKYLNGQKTYADFNSDGQTDYLTNTVNNSLAIFYDIGSTESTALNYFSSFSRTLDLNGSNLFNFQMLDFNDDGLVDVLAEESGVVKLYQAKRDELDLLEFGIYGRHIDFDEVQLFDAGNELVNSTFKGVLVEEIKTNEADIDITGSDLTGIPLRNLATLKYGDMPSIMDFNGDGVTDILYFGGDKKLYSMQRNTGISQLGKLEKVTDSFGNNTRFTYQTSQLNPITNYGAVRFPYMNVANTTSLVATMERGKGSDAYPSGYTKSSYEFAGAQVHLQGRGYMGLGGRSTITMLDSDSGIQEVEYFNQVFPLTGTVKEKKRYLLETNNDPELLSYNGFTWNVAGLDFINSQVVMPYLHNTVTKKSDLNGIEIGGSLVTDDYDHFGNLTQKIIETYDGSDEALTRQVTDLKYLHVVKVADSNYVSSELTNWRISFPTESKTTSTVDGVSVTQIQKFVPKGDTHQILTKTDYVGTDQELIHEYTYYPENNALLESETLTSGSGVEHSITQRTEFTNNNFSHGYLPSSITNATGKTASIDYDNTWHQPIKQTSVQGLSQETSYDDWGAAYKTVSPEGVISLNLTNRCESNCPTGAYYSSTQLQMHKSQKGFLSPPQIRYFDSLGQVLREETRNANGDTIYQDYSYDKFGRLSTSTLPYTGNDSEEITYDSYDIFNRNLQASYPDGGVVNTTYTGTANGILQSKTVSTALPDGITGTSPSDQTTTSLQNILGQVTQVVNNQSGLTNNYQYDALGNLKLAKIYEGSALLKQVSASYNGAGLKEQISDPDTGTYNYTYDALGLMRTQSDSRGNDYVYSYDTLNQQITSTLNGQLDASWVYSEYIPGLLTQRFKTDFNESYKYDNLHRVKEVSTQLKSLAARKFEYQYDDAGRLLQTQYPSGFNVEAVYSPLGFLNAYRKPGTEDNYWQATTMDAFGNWVGERYGNGIQTARSYDPTSGLLASIKSGKTTAGDEDVQNLSYKWLSNGNLYSRAQGTSLTETFSYDGVNRLKTAKTTGLPQTTTRELKYNYDALGNMTYKSDLSDVNGMVYGSATSGPSRLQSVSKNYEPLFSYQYDASGNMVQRGNTYARYTAANKPSHLWQGNQHNYFLYDTDEQRFYQEQISGSNTVQKIYYFGSGYEEVFDVATQAHKQKAYVGGVMIHTYTQSPEHPGKYADIQYLHHDHLGSTQAISYTNSSGNLDIQTLAFDPFGKARQSNWEDLGTAGEDDPNWNDIALKHTSTGFTGHEMLGDFELIHMGGRLYDPIAGRMMSADPFIQAPYNGQNYNRFSYTLNNPLSLTDPSGYMYTYDNYYIENIRFEQDMYNLSNSFGFNNTYDYTAALNTPDYSYSLKDSVSTSGNYSVHTVASVQEYAPSVQVNKPEEILSPVMQAVIGGEMLAGDGWLGSPGTPKFNTIDIVSEQIPLWVAAEYDEEAVRNNAAEISRWSGHASGTAFMGGQFHASGALGLLSTVSGGVVLSIDVKNYDVENAALTGSSLGASRVMGENTKGFVNMLPTPAKVPVRAGMTILDMFSQEIFYQAGKDGEE